MVQDAQRPVAGDRALAARASGDGLVAKRPELLPYKDSEDVYKDSAP
ncbi:hypothetical protein [Streptomyces pseudovenezuelae]|nr:hypothetical protein [Streptomyces pseudovenezuelae]